MVIDGCPYKENQKERAWETGLSTTLSQISTIKPEVLVNQETTPPTITVEVNGTSSTANLPSGGGSTNEWEELTLSALPTDFADGDELIIIYSFASSASNIMWNESFTSNDIDVHGVTKEVTQSQAYVRLVSESEGVNIANSGFICNTYAPSGRAFNVDMLLVTTNPINWNQENFTIYTAITTVVNSVNCGRDTITGRKSSIISDDIIHRILRRKA